MAETIGSDETRRLCALLVNQRRQLIHRALIAWDRSPETFGEEIVALNDIQETLNTLCLGEHIDQE